MKYHFLSITTGQLVCNLKDVLRESLSDLVRFGVINIWKYSKSGF